MTYDIVANLTLNSDFADKVAHMASVYADGPSLGIRMWESTISQTNLYHRSGVDYSGTENSQSDNRENVVRHSMLTSGDSRTKEQAIYDGLAFGWQNIFNAASASYSEDLNSEFMRSLGVGLHALQDAYAHEGASMDEHLGFHTTAGKMFLNDMFSPTYGAESITKSALVAVQVLKGNFSNVKKGMNLNLAGASKSQVRQVVKALRDAGYEVEERGE